VIVLPKPECMVLAWCNVAVHKLRERLKVSPREAILPANSQPGDRLNIYYIVEGRPGANSRPSIPPERHGHYVI